LIAAVFYIERSAALFHSIKSVLLAFGKVAPETDNKKLDNAWKLASSETKRGFWAFISLLALSLVLGVATILFAIWGITTVPASGQQLSASESNQVTMVVVAFASFLITTIAVVVSWVYSGFFLATITSGKFESMAHAIEQLPEYRNRIESKSLSLIRERIKADETRLGKKLSKEELLAILESMNDEKSELGHQVSSILESEKQRIRIIAEQEVKNEKS
jgi:ABC-type multidrug transport system fused ATPase/permease subunit